MKDLEGGKNSFQKNLAQETISWELQDIIAFTEYCPSIKESQRQTSESSLRGWTCIISKHHQQENQKLGHPI